MSRQGRYLIEQNRGQIRPGLLSPFGSRLLILVEDIVLSMSLPSGFFTLPTKDR